VGPYERVRLGSVLVNQ